MKRGKVVMKRIENAASRLVSFSKRRSGLLKKAFELSVLCDVEVAVIIFSQKGTLYEFSSSEMALMLCFAAGTNPLRCILPFSNMSIRVCKSFAARN
ncbi:hypothetical protein SLEP1_g3603 [Rubroshorea leprosula]|uniref:MADS-box domain-containing protein n=1 Tax=Rubroshorea leprosula TaxID=152421 RepID=A0AAV5HWR9_9ROSI|nr:hypothetical protein SLEP1_g3603 [Rubroshorea leprosula]